MPVGLEVFNEAGVRQHLNFARNVMYVTKGTVTRPSNKGALGYRNTVTGLPVASQPYLIFIRCNNGNACVTSSTNSSFSYFLAQGTTSFQWWAFNVGRPAGIAAPSVGLEVFDEAGNLLWEVGRPALRLRFLNTKGAAVPNVGFTGTPNILSASPLPTFAIAANEAVLYTDHGFIMHGVYPCVNQTVQAHCRYLPCISTPTGRLILRWGRIAADLSLPSGMSFQNIGQPYNPQVALVASIPGGI